MAVDPAFRSISITPVRFGRQSSSGFRWRISLPCRAAIYLVSALLLRVTSGYAFPLLPVAAWIAALTLVFVAAAWSTRNRTIQVLVMMVAVLRAFGVAMDRLTAVELPGGYDWPPRLWPTLFDFPRTDYAWIALIGLASFGVTVAGVTRQRRGDGWVEVPSAQRDGFWDRLVHLFRFPCPTSSATRAQVWLDLKSNGLPVLTIGVALAIVILLLSAVSGPIDAAINADPDVSCPIRECFYVRAQPPLLAPLSLFVMLLPRRKCLRYSPETRTHVHERIRGDTCARHRTAGRPQGTREVGLRPGRNHRDRRERMDIGATAGRCGLHPDVGRCL